MYTVLCSFSCLQTVTAPAELDLVDVLNVLFQILAGEAGKEVAKESRKKLQPLAQTLLRRKRKRDEMGMIYNLAHFSNNKCCLKTIITYRHVFYDPPLQSSILGF